ncbi:MAG TPA: hypothetical protein VIV60_32200, partial [Polyangiaceae bacterium]
MTAVSATAIASTAVGGALGATAPAASASTLLLVAKAAVIGVVSASVMLGSAAGVQRYRAKARTTATVSVRVSSTPVLSRSNTAEQPAPLVSASRIELNTLAPTPLASNPPTRNAQGVPPAPTAVGANAAPNRTVTTARPQSATAIPTVESAISEPTSSEPQLVDEMEVIDAARLRLRAG